MLELLEHATGIYWNLQLISPLPSPSGAMCFVISDDFGSSSVPFFVRWSLLRFAFLGLLLEDGGFIPVAIQADLLHLDGASTQAVPERSCCEPHRNYGSSWGQLNIHERSH